MSKPPPDTLNKAFLYKDTEKQTPSLDELAYDKDYIVDPEAEKK